MTADAHSKSSTSLGTTIKVGKDASSSKKIPPASNLEHGSLEYCACFSRSIIILSFLLYDCRGNTSSSFRRHSKSSINTKARPEHQHGLLDFYFSLSSLGSTSTTLGPLGCETCTFGLRHRRERNACCSATYVCLRGVTINDRRAAQ